MLHNLYKIKECKKKSEETCADQYIKESCNLSANKYFNRILLGFKQLFNSEKHKSIIDGTVLDNLINQSNDIVAIKIQRSKKADSSKNCNDSDKSFDLIKNLSSIFTNGI